MSDKQQYQAVMAFAIWKSASIGLVLGLWLGHERFAQPLGALVMVGLGAVLVYGTWRRARQAFWPEDYRRG